jgi:hypothetical protein
MNLTLSIDEHLVEQAREAARLRGTSLSSLIREYIEVLAGKAGGEQVLASFEALWKDAGSSGAKASHRDDLYDERMSRYKPR